MRQGILDIHAILHNFEYNRTDAQLDEVKFKARELEEILASYQSQFIEHVDSSNACLIIKVAVIDAKHLTVSCDKETIDEIKDKFIKADAFLVENKIKHFIKEKWVTDEARGRVTIQTPLGPVGEIEIVGKKGRRF
jgi:hypothetical protein